MDAWGIAGAVFLGLVLGSFATALSYRLPRGISIAAVKRSQCPACGKTLGAPDLVPLFSWLFLKGRCRHCRAPIGWRYPLIELATLVLCLAFYAVYGLSRETVLVFALAPVLVSILDIDLHHKIIPDSLNLAILLTGIGLLLVNALLSRDVAGFFVSRGLDAVGGAVLYGAGALLLRQAVMLALRREPMGLGDVKFCAAAGFFLGLDIETAALFMTVAGFSGIAAALLWKKSTGEDEVPFGPSLVAAFTAALGLHVPGFMGV